MREDGGDVFDIKFVSLEGEGGEPEVAEGDVRTARSSVVLKCWPAYKASRSTLASRARARRTSRIDWVMRFLENRENRSGSWRKRSRRTSDGCY